MAEKIEQAQITEVNVEKGDIIQVKDDTLLQAMGYQQHMKRGFTMWSMTAFCLTGIGLLPSLGGVEYDHISRLGWMLDVYDTG
ncbi:MAG: hypothetical protein M1834_007023 [Cirrosporium novae-zelandiae]|nr:MAG: hypothetical protein M1834_007023 [Cirrosporium novae-zelandiae]